MGVPYELGWAQQGHTDLLTELQHRSEVNQRCWHFLPPAQLKDTFTVSCDPSVVAHQKDIRLLSFVVSSSAGPRLINIAHDFCLHYPF